MKCQQNHGLDQALNAKAFSGVLGVDELQSIREFRYPMLDLNSGVHFHEEMIRSLNDALKGRDAIEPDPSSESFGVAFHGQQGLGVLGQSFSLGSGVERYGLLQQL